MNANQAYKRKGQSPVTPRWDAFSALCQAHGLPAPELEYRFEPTRRWRFDYAWPQRRVAIEQEGGAWTRGRHTRGAGFIADLQKYNQATLAGWKVLRYTPQQMARGDCLPVLQVLLLAGVARVGAPDA